MGQTKQRFFYFENFYMLIGCHFNSYTSLSYQLTGHRVCSKRDQFDLFESNYFKLGRMDQPFVEAQTGCLLPCTYDEYRVLATGLRDFNKYGVVLTYGSLGTTVLTEYYIYPFESLVSDFGGSLGLFVGFSFVMLWDVLQLAITCCCHKMNNN